MASRHAGLSLALLLPFVGLFLCFYLFLLPYPYAIPAVYGVFVAGLVIAARKSNSKYFRAGAIVLASFWLVSTLANAALPKQIELGVQGLASVPVFAYFFWQARRPNAQHQDIHAALAYLAAGTTALYSLMLLAPITPWLSQFHDYWLFKFLNNRLFDLQILALLIASRLRVIAHRDRAAWRKTAYNLTAGRSKPTRNDAIIEGGWGFQPLQDDIGKDGPTILMEKISQAFGEKLGRKDKEKQRQPD